MTRQRDEYGERGCTPTGYTAFVLLVLTACDPGAAVQLYAPGETPTAADTAELAPGFGDTGTLDPTDTIFDPAVIHEFSLDMDAEAWVDITQNPYAENWHSARFRWGADTVEDVGIRTFGAGSLIYTKPSLKIAFDHFVPGQEWQGLEQIKLDNSSQDYGFLNETIGTAILRREGIPAVRTGYARVVVNDAPAGFFVLLEPVDDVYLRRWFGTDTGNLYGTADSRYAQGLNPIPVGGPLDWFTPQTKTETDGSDILAIAEIVASGTDDQLTAALDVDQFTRMSVTRSVFGGIDTMSADGNNYFLYNDAGYWSIIAWDLDADLGYPWYFSNALSVDPRAPWLTSPWAYNPVTGAPYTDPVLSRALAMGADTDALVGEVLVGGGDWATVDAEIVAAAELIRDDVYADVLGYGPYFDLRRHDLRLFVHTRISQLLGRDAAPCEDADPGTWRVGDLSPVGTVGWGNMLVDSTNWGPGFTVGGEHYCTGVFAHAPSDVQVTIPGGATIMSAGVGLQDWVQQCGDGASFAIVQDRITLWESAVRRNYEPVLGTGEVRVSPGELHLVSSPNTEYSCDTAAWVDVVVR